MHISCFNTSKDLTAVPTLEYQYAITVPVLFQHLKGFNGRSHELVNQARTEYSDCFNTSKDLTAVPTALTTATGEWGYGFNTSKDLTAVPTITTTETQICGFVSTPQRI